MTVRTRTIQAVLGTISDAVNVAPRTVVARPPSDLDALDDEISVYVNGVEITRAYDPEMPQP